MRPPPMHRRLAVTALLLAGCGLAGCGDGAGDATSTSSSGPPVVSVVTDPPTQPSETGPPQTGPPETGPPVPTTEDEGPSVVLAGDGLGAERFGAPVDQVIAALTLRWAPPDTDSGWGPAATSPFGPCPGTRVRVVAWRGFRVYFSDGPTPHGPAGAPHFFTWEYLADNLDAPGPDPGGNRPPLRTEAGVSVGDSVSDLQRSYGARLELFDEEPAGPSFGVQLPDGGIFGSLTTIDPRGAVRSITGGGGCGEGE